jgi:hypothetical protein
MGMDSPPTLADTCGGELLDSTTGSHGVSMATSTVKRQIDIIDEQWKDNHIEALSCWEFEDLLRLCIETFERIGRQDEGWRSAVFCGERPYSAEEENGFAALYAAWRDVCTNFLGPLTHFEERGYVVECGNQFRGCVREAEGILTPDAEFFDADTVARLRDEAIEEHRRGEAEHVGGQG